LQTKYNKIDISSPENRQKSRKMKLFHKNSWQGCVNLLSLHSQIRNNATEAPEKAKMFFEFLEETKDENFCFEENQRS
jgi:hypothetical protein